MRLAAGVLACLLASVLASPLASFPGQAAGFDEFQVFDGRVDAPGDWDVNLHLNAGRKGIREPDGGAPRNGALFTAEIGYVLAPWYQAALYLPFAQEFSGGLFEGGFKFRNSFVMPNSGERPLALGLDVEFHDQPARFAETTWGVTLRPIIDLRTGPWQLILNPGVDFPIGRSGPVFAPAIRGVRQVAEDVWLGLEHYMDFDRISRPAKPAGQAQQLFATTDVKVSERFTFQLGLGHGLTHASDRWLGKVILYLDF